MNKWYHRPAPIAQELFVAEDTADVIVVGLGFSGTAAARAAAEAGARVIAVESMVEERFNTFGRDIGHINSRFLKSRGVPQVDPIDLYNEMMRRAGNRANPSLVMQFCQTCGDTFDWLTDSWGPEGLSALRVAYWPEGGEKFKAHVGQDFNGYHFWNGTAQFPEHRGFEGHPTLVETIRDNHQKIRNAGGRLYFGTQAVDVILEGERVTGIVAKEKTGGYLRLYAKKGVILAAGDFAGNTEMLEDLVPDILELLPPGKKIGPRLGRKGMGIRMGVWAGGALEPRPLALMGGNYSQVPGFTTFASLWLDSDGNRFCNEVFGGPELAGFAANQMPSGIFYNIFDQNVKEDLAWSYPAHGSFDEGDHASRPMEGLDRIMANATQYPTGHPDSMKVTQGPPNPNMADNIYSGATPEELADNAGLTGQVRENVIASIHRYIKLCKAGRDQDFGKDPKLLRPFTGRLFLQKAPMGSNLGVILVTVGGLVTDSKQNVLNRNYQRIPGLYATGNCCGRRFGPQYTTPIAGVSIGMAVTLGRQAGLAAAAAPAMD